MTFTIRWREAALDDLASAWLKASAAQRARITRATHAMERELSFEPHQKGESRPDGERIIFNAPIGALYQVDERNRQVVIEQVWLFDAR